MNIKIRIATIQDREVIRDLNLQAFPDGENHLIADLACNLLSNESDPETVTLIAEMSGEIVGHAAFSPVYEASGKSCLGYILSPLCVNPKHQKTGIGSRLVEAGIERLSEKGVNLFLVYGDPDYYCRFGFGAEAASDFLAPYELKYPFGWLAILRDQRYPDEQRVKLLCVESLSNPALW